MESVTTEALPTQHNPAAQLCITCITSAGMTIHFGVEWISNEIERRRRRRSRKRSRRRKARERGCGVGSEQWKWKCLKLLYYSVHLVNQLIYQRTTSYLLQKKHKCKSMCMLGSGTAAGAEQPCNRLLLPRKFFATNRFPFWV